MLNNLKHPNIVTVYDIGTTAGYYYIVMELLEGHTLRREMQHFGAMLLPRVTHLVNQLAAALDYAHRQGIIHYGLVTSLGRNPDNSIVVNDGQVSRYHAVIRSQASAWFITDQGSTNGTFVNDVKRETVLWDNQDKRGHRPLQFER